MNLLERKNDFDVKVKAYIAKEYGMEVDGDIEATYGLYTRSINDFKSINWNKQKNYVQIEFYSTEEMKEREKINLKLIS